MSAAQDVSLFAVYPKAQYCLHVDCLNSSEIFLSEAELARHHFTHARDGVGAAALDSPDSAAPGLAHLLELQWAASRIFRHLPLRCCLLASATCQTFRRLATARLSSPIQVPHDGWSLPAAVRTAARLLVKTVRVGAGVFDLFEAPTAEMRLAQAEGPIGEAPVVELCEAGVTLEGAGKGTTTITGLIRVSGSAVTVRNLTIRNPNHSEGSFPAGRGKWPGIHIMEGTDGACISNATHDS